MSLRFYRIMQEVYYHIIQNPPPNREFRGSDAWDYFIVQYNYPMYNEYIDDVDRWPKFMFLLYLVYTHAYNQYYRLRSSKYAVKKLPPYNRQRTTFFLYIIKLYDYANRNSTLQELRDWGY